jgi:aryl-alcohol dehydrogenase-like predicted oxidoreductase
MIRGIVVAPSICLGTAGFGTAIKGPEMHRLYELYRELGGSFLDSAHVYAFWEPGGLGASERAVGDLLRTHGREGVTVATKGAHPDAGSDYPRPDQYMSPERITQDVAESLERLQIDQIDLYYPHRDDRRVPVGEIIEALNAEIDRGRVRMIGASNWSVERIEEANAYAKEKGRVGFTAVQNHWSLADPIWKAGPDPSVYTVMAEMADWHRKTQMPLVPYSPNAGGFFAGREAPAYETDGNRARRERARELASSLGRTPTQVAIAYLMSQPFPVTPIVGTHRPENLRDAFGARDLRLADEQVRYLASGEASTATG